ncbi:MAG: replicative DNA helicase [Endomicrobium sp.]|nr:replicative DNA helicase [Endomicrobium sp.]
MNELKKLIPPQAIEAEEAVIGSMLIEKEAIIKLIGIIDENDFYNGKNKRIYKTIMELYIEDEAVDLLTVCNALKKKGEEDRELMKYLISLVDRVPTAANVEYYGRIIRDKSVGRKIIKIGTKTVKDVFNENEGVENILERVQDELFKISGEKRGQGFTSITKLVTPTLTKLEKLHLNPRDVSGLSTGFRDFDEKTGGLHSGELIILAARPSMGKTAFALNIAEHVGIKENKGVGIFSLEMKKEALMVRFLASVGRVNGSKLRNGRYNVEDWVKLTASASKISKSPIYIDDDSDISVIEIRGRARKLESELKVVGKKLELIIIDYIQFIKGSMGRYDTRQQEVADISRSLKGLAKDLEIPVVAISQLSRRTEERGRKDNRPQLSDLRDSGAIEQDADVVVMLYREGYYNREDLDLAKKASLIIGKQRNGPTGEIKLIFEGEYTKFSEASEEDSIN